MPLLAVLGLAPLVHRSPSGLECYLLSMWSVQYSLFLAGWEALLLLAGSVVLAGSSKKAAFKWVVVVLSNYLVVVIGSALYVSLGRRAYQEGQFGYAGWIHHPELLAAHKPDCRARVLQLNSPFLSFESRIVSIQLDSEGFRNDTTVPDEVDLAFLGDSFTFGANVSQDELFTTLASQALGLRGRNYGVIGSGQGTQWRLLQKYILRKRPRIVVVQYYDNDGLDNLRFLEWMSGDRTEAERGRWAVGREDLDKTLPWTGVWDGSYLGRLAKTTLFQPTDRSRGFTIEFKAATLHFYHPPLRHGTPEFLDLPPPLARELASYAGSAEDTAAATKHVAAVVAKHFPASRYDREQRWRTLDQVSLDAFCYYSTRQFIEAIIDESATVGAKVLVARIPSAWLTYSDRITPVRGTPESISQVARRHWVGRESLDQLLAQVCSAKGARYVSALQEWPHSEEFYYWKYDTHLNVAGHRAFSQFLVKHLRETGWLLSAKTVPANE